MTEGYWKQSQPISFSAIKPTGKVQAIDQSNGNLVEIDFDNGGKVIVLTIPPMDFVKDFNGMVIMATSRAIN